MVLRDSLDIFDLVACAVGMVMGGDGGKALGLQIELVCLAFTGSTATSKLCARADVMQTGDPLDPAVA